MMRTLWDVGDAYGVTNRARVVAQIQYINQLTLEAAQRWASAGNAAVVVSRTTARGLTSGTKTRC